MGWLKNLNRLSGSLELWISLSDDPRDENVVEDAREAELSKKMHIQNLEIFLTNGAGVVMDVVNALEPHPHLQELKIAYYEAARLPGWITSPLNQLRSITLRSCTELSLLPPLGKLPFLENIQIDTLRELQFLGREFLGITTRRGGDQEDNSSTVIGFPKLKKLKFKDCPGWKEWEDITAEEEHSDLIFLMPCLKELILGKCDGLTKLPHRLLHKAAAALEVLDIRDSKQLEQVYGDKKGEAWKSISHHNPRLCLKVD